MKTAHKLWISFKKSPHIYLFYLFIFLFTLQVRKVLFAFDVKNYFNEFTSGFFYLSDILIIATLLVWLVVLLCYKKYKLSNNISVFFQSIHMEYWKKFLTKHFFILFLPFLLVIFSFISLIWTESKILTLYHSIKLFEFYLFYIFIIYNYKKLNLSLLFFALIIPLTVQSIIAILQFLFQSSVGLHSLLQESIVSRGTIGTAKIFFANKTLIRAYGLFPHPNILGGFLALSSVTTIFYLKFKSRIEMFHVEQSIFNKLLNCSTWNNLIVISLILQLMALILTFSKSAWLGFALGLIFLIVPRGTLSRNKKNKLFHVEQFRYILYIVLITILLIIILPINLNVTKSTTDRLLYANVSRGTILENSQNLTLGIGTGNSVSHQLSVYPQLEYWQYQPVHNIFLLITTELGLIGIILFCWWTFLLLKCSTWNINLEIRPKNIPPISHTSPIKIDECGINKIGNKDYYLTILLKYCLIIILIISIFDHYFWDIQQGQILFWLITGLIAGITINNYNNTRQM